MPKLSPVSYRRLAAVFEAEGFVCVRTVSVTTFTD